MGLNIQYIGYSINTAPARIGERQVYMGLPTDQADISARLAWTARVLEAIESKVDSTSIKLFMIPEFYFRGAQGAYQLDNVTTLVSGLQEMVKDSKWSNWLFVFGSAVGRSSADYDPAPFAGYWDSLLDSDPFEPKEEIYNFVLVQSGGWEATGQTADEAARVVLKENLSSIDFAQVTEGLPLSRVEHLPALRGPGVGREAQRLNYDGAGIFNYQFIDPAESDPQTVTFGLELCLDHAAHRLKNSPQPEGADGIQVQLVPSCGMTLRTDAIVALKGGQAFNVDGLSNVPPTMLGAHSQLQSVTTEYTILDDATVTADAPFQVDDLAGLEDGYAADYSELFGRGRGEVHLYHPVAVTPAKKVGG